MARKAYGCCKFVLLSSKFCTQILYLSYLKRIIISYNSIYFIIIIPTTRGPLAGYIPDMCAGHSGLIGNNQSRHIWPGRPRLETFRLPYMYIRISSTKCYAAICHNTIITARSGGGNVSPHPAEHI